MRVKLFESKAGTAGQWADSVSATIGYDNKQIRLSITDMIRVCKGAPGTTKAWLEVERHPLKKRRQREVKVHGAVGVLIEEERPTLSFLLSDRCSVQLTPGSGRPVTAKDIEEAVTIVDFESLGRTCRKRQKLRR